MIINVGKFLGLFIKTKIPTLILIGLFLYIGASLIKNSEIISASGISGIIVLGIGALLGIFSFADYRNREHTDHIVEHYRKALETLSLTHSKYEETKQNTLNKVNQDLGGEKSTYSIEASEGTLAG